MKDYYVVCLFYIAFSALCNPNWGSSIAVSAVSDPFTVVRRIVERKGMSPFCNTNGTANVKTVRPMNLLS